MDKWERLKEELFKYNGTSLVGKEYLRETINKIEFESIQELSAPMPNLTENVKAAIKNGPYYPPITNEEIQEIKNWLKCDICRDKGDLSDYHLYIQQLLAEREILLKRIHNQKLEIQNQTFICPAIETPHTPCTEAE